MDIMSHAWLDSLSDDWDSQNESDDSQSAAASSTRDHSTKSTTTGSVRHMPAASSANGSNILSERCFNEVSIQSRRASSRLSSRLPRRSVSASTAGSVIHNTIEHHKSHSASPSKGRDGDTPEWRRRLIHGNVGFGEQCDLFSPTRLGLETIFQPPPEAQQPLSAPDAAAEASLTASAAPEDESQADADVMAHANGREPRPEYEKQQHHDVTQQHGATYQRNDTQQQDVMQQTYQNRLNNHILQTFNEDSEMPTDLTMPSSPPVIQNKYSLSIRGQELEAPELPQQRIPHHIQYEESQLEEAEHGLGPDGPALQPDDQAGQAAGEQRGYPELLSSSSVTMESHIYSSGQSVLRNESFSAIVISPEKANGNGNGAVFGPLDLPAGELKRRLENLKWNQMVLADDEKKAAAAQDVSALSGDEKRPAKDHADSTGEYEKMGGFINFRRGGRSDDGSFRGRLLSLSDAENISELLRDDSMQASTPKQFATVRTEKLTPNQKPLLVSVPRAPYPSPEKRPQKELSAKGASPLKLFGPYDTFTNQTLMRRISQYEDQSSSGASALLGHGRGEAAGGADGADGADADADADGGERGEPSQSEVQLPERSDSENAGQSTQTSSIRFGVDDFKGYSFVESLNLASDLEIPNGLREPRTTFPLYSDKADEGRNAIGGKLNNLGELHIKRLRQSVNTESLPSGSSRPSTGKQPEEHEETTTATEGAAGAAGTRPRTPRRSAESGSEKRQRPSPSKGPTPKRRRTLHKTDIAFSAEEAPQNGTHASKKPSASNTSGRKRLGKQQVVADADVLANRQIRSPHAPTLSRRSSSSQGQHQEEHSQRHEYTEDYSASELPDSRRDDEDNTHWARSPESFASGPPVAPPAGLQAGPQAGRPAAAGVDGFQSGNTRKPSIKTQDFLDEASAVMAMLRKRAAEGGMGSGLASVEESGMETPKAAGDEDGEAVGCQEDSDDSFQESTKEPFSRPPSREGRGPVPRPAGRQQDPDVIARLKKFAEHSEMEDLIASTTRSINLAQGAILVEQQVELSVQETLGASLSRNLRPPVREKKEQKDSEPHWMADSDVVSDPPNIRISVNPDRQSPTEERSRRNRRSSSFGTQVSQGSISSGHGSVQSMQSVGSMPTGSSRGSDSRKTIAPQTVSHLIPDQVGNMMLDRDRNLWIRHKKSASAALPSRHINMNILPSEASEDDPFADIPDLTVDETMEMRNLKASAATSAPGTLGRGPLGSLRDHDGLDGLAKKKEEVRETAERAPKAAMRQDYDNGHEHDDYDNDGPVEHEISIDEGRSTRSSRSKKRHLAISFSSPIASIIQDFAVDEGDSDMSTGARASKDAGDGELPSQGPVRSFMIGRKAVPVKFQSTERARTMPTSMASAASAALAADASGSAALPVRSRSVSRGPQRRLSVAGETFLPRPISRIDEREEDSTGGSVHAEAYAIRQPEAEEDEVAGEPNSTLVHVAPGRGDSSLSSILSTPNRLQMNDTANSIRQQASASLMKTPAEQSLHAVGLRNHAGHDDDENLMAQYVGMLSLSPMSEFTIHRDDRSLALEASYVLGDRHLKTRGHRAGRGGRKGDGDTEGAVHPTTVMSQSLRILVERIAEVEPFEPYWEDLEELEVKGRQLESLHQLNGFCPQLVTLDVSGNALHSLNGVPTSVRHLSIIDNRLSELTAWSQLANLQYIDVSHNPSLRTLSGLKNLVHLRGLKADDCGLTSLDGIRYHAGLQTLRARGNALETMDFRGTRLQKLVELDLEDSQIARIDGLEELGALVTLNLRRNALQQLTKAALTSQAKETGETTSSASAKTGGRVLRMATLRTLNVSDNDLESLDVRGLPFLRTLLADRNRLAKVRGFSKTPRLDSVSLREQRLGPDDTLDISSLYHAYEIRKLFLSGNRLAGFDPPVAFLNLQLLELANCGLTSLPPTLGQRLPNLRKLNVNLNGLSNLRCLQGIPRLKKLMAVGNRLTRPRAVVEVLSGLAHLAEVDLRDNPLTQGFYARGVLAEQKPTTALATVKKTAAAAKPTRTKKDSKKDSKNESETQTESETETPAPTVEPFSLGAADAQQDEAYCSRLDLATAMRRRVYEQVVMEACGHLRRLDGLAARQDVAEVHDAVWQALQAKGIMGVVGKREKRVQA